MLSRGPLLWIGTFFILWLTLQLTWSYGTLDQASAHAHAAYTKFVKADVSDVKNDTLGFQRIFAVSMPERTDKRDTLALAASLSGIRFEWADGVDASKVPDKAIPESWDREETNGTYGCWRAHMNIAQKMVAEQIPSALIIEDDADWDVHLKQQLVEFARGTRFIFGQENVVTSSPYGDGWDLLWVGHCGLRNIENIDQRYYVIRDDPTAVPQSQWGYPRRQPNLTPPQLNGTWNRVVYKPYRGLCTFSYALSLQGARKLLQDQALVKALPSDRALNRLCSHIGGSCLAPYPTLIGTHRAAGASSKDSDREDTDGKVRKVGVTGQIVFSTKLNFKQLIPIGDDRVIKSQWPGETMLNEINGTLEIPRGEGVWVTKQEYTDFPRPD